MTTAAVIVAAGRGQRAGAGAPKQWRRLAGRPVLAHVLDAFRAAGIARILLVLHPDDTERAAALGHGFETVPGGVSRDSSVRNALEALAGGGVTRVLIHDGARPLASPALIARVVGALDAAAGAAPALAVTEALWRGRDGHVRRSIDRAELYRAQTPQGFDFEAILKAHRAHPGGAADDVEVARAAGLDVAIVEGEEDNIKLTWPADFARAERLLRQSDRGGGDSMDVRTGSGFDVHRFTEGAGVVLCGVEIAHERALAGHSDADVAIHALCDAIYGALGEGDIGVHFPPSDPQWKGVASRVFLEHACARAVERGFRLGNLDVTLICERPKIGPHAGAMRASLAAITGLAQDRINVKATTSEGLGFAGRGEGIAAMAAATLVAP